MKEQDESSKSALALNTNCHSRSSLTWDIAESYESCLNGGNPPKDYLYGLVNMDDGHTCMEPTEISYSQIGGYGITNADLVAAGYKKADGDKIIVFQVVKKTPPYSNYEDKRTNFYTANSGGNHIMLALVYTIGSGSGAVKKNRIIRTGGKNEK